MPLLLPIIGMSVLAAYLLRGTWLFIPALINAVLNFWSLGIQWNYGSEPPPGVVGNIASAVSMLTSAAGLILLVVAWFVR